MKMDNDKNALSSYKALIEQYGTPITTDEFKALREYAMDRHVKLSGFKGYVGKINTIKTVVDDICEIAKDFPLILDARKGIWLELDYSLGSDFATTEGEHIIHLNGGYFSNLVILEKEYNEAVSYGRFVKGTDWRAIARHETGHVVSYLYRIDPMEVALSIMPGLQEADVLDVLGDELSLYSVEYDDGREIISECFSAVYSKVGITFAEKFLNKCKYLAKESE